MMNAKKQAIAILSVLLIFITSCQKEAVLTPTNDDSLIESAAVSSDATAANNVAETAYPTHNPVFSTINGNCAGYLATLPARYNLTTKQYPLIIFIHGIGELGTGLRINCCGIPNMATNHRLPPEYIVGGVHFSPIYISPQFRVRPSASDIQAVINYAVKRYRVDPTRIYVTGLSMGGGSTLDYANVYGQNITAIAPVCGGTAASTTLARNIASKRIPVWGIYSWGDQVVPASWGVNLINWMKSDNPSMSASYKLTVYSNLSHNSTWGTAFKPTQRTDGYSLYEWLLRFKKGSVPVGGGGVTPAPTPTPTSGNKAPIAKAGADQFISLKVRNNAFLNGAFSTDSDGWLNKYTWTKVSGPSTNIAYYSLTQVHANNLVVGTYVFRVTVTDNKGATAYDDVKVTVTK